MGWFKWALLDINKREWSCQEITGLERQERPETLVLPTCTKQKTESSIVNHCALCISHVTNLITSKQSQYPLRLWDGFVSNKLDGSTWPHSLKNVSWAASRWIRWSKSMQKLQHVISILLVLDSTRKAPTITMIFPRIRPVCLTDMTDTRNIVCSCLLMHNTIRNPHLCVGAMGKLDKMSTYFSQTFCHESTEITDQLSKYKIIKNNYVGTMKLTGWSGN